MKLTFMQSNHGLRMLFIQGSGPSELCGGFSQYDASLRNATVIIL